MQKDYLNYSKLVNEATRSIIKKVLSKVAKDGMPGDHHFYITFNTLNDEVKISPKLLKKYPNEMTIVIQHQYQDLLVDSKSFSITLSFGGTKEFIVIPFRAISYFADPSIDFVLKLEYQNIPEANFFGDEYEEMFTLHEPDNSENSFNPLNHSINNVVDLSTFRKNKNK
jgi:hypothetical protein